MFFIFLILLLQYLFKSFTSLFPGIHSYSNKRKTCLNDRMKCLNAVAVLSHSVFWDLYCAAPDRRETCEHSSEAKAFHDYVSELNQSCCTAQACPTFKYAHACAEHGSGRSVCRGFGITLLVLVCVGLLQFLCQTDQTVIQVYDLYVLLGNL